MTETTIRTLLARSRLYRRLADAFDYPTAEFADALRSGEWTTDVATAAATLPVLDGEDDTLEAACLDALTRLNERRASLTLDALESDFIGTFGHALSRECPPYETEYLGERLFYQSQQLADIGGFYRAFGLDVAETTHERLDHIAVELEFLHVATAREANAVNAGETENAKLCRDAQRTFVQDHPGRWVPYFTELVASVAPSATVRLFADVLRWFIAFETQYLETSPERITGVRQDEPFEGECEWMSSSDMSHAGETI
jgi:DMSO reductase family type II enzyme chaperone